MSSFIKVKWCNMNFRKLRDSSVILGGNFWEFWNMLLMSSYISHETRMGDDLENEFAVSTFKGH